MILAAGRGERMRPLTDVCPKPMLKVAGIPLIEHHVINLAKAGITDIVINHAWLGEQIEVHLKNGEHLGVSIQYSREGAQALETAGGIIKALPQLIDKVDINTPFLVINGDIFTDFDFTHIALLPSDCLAKIWLVENPQHNLTGDFYLGNGKIKNKAELLQDQSFTFTGIGLYKPSFFQDLSNEKVLALGPVLRALADNNQLAGELISGCWTDVGTPQRLEQLNQK